MAPAEPVSPQATDRADFAAAAAELLDLVRHLSGPEGCPWDREQTSRTLSPYVVEEAHEIGEAIAHGDAPAAREELGDLFFLVAFLAVALEREGGGTPAAVIQGNLAKMIARDGEGATKLVEVRIFGGRTPREARLAAEAVANSPLVKTTLFGEDINWGRVMAALGRSGAWFDAGSVDLLVDELPVVKGGVGLGGSAEAAVNHRLRQREFALVVHLHAGPAAARVWTTDLSEAYVRINAGYRT